MTKEDFDQIIKQVDANKDGKVDYNEFLAASVDISAILT